MGLLWGSRAVTHPVASHAHVCMVWGVRCGDVAPFPDSGWFADIFPRIVTFISQHQAVLVLLSSMLIG